MSNIIGIIALLAAIAILIYFVYNGVSIVATCFGCAILVAVCNGLEIWPTIGTTFVGSFASTIQSYILIFMVSSCYAGIMDACGATVTIGRVLVKWFGEKRALLVSCAIVAILNFGGISLWVVMFAAGPIMYYLFKAADLPRHLTMACLSIGCTTFTMTCLPGSTALTNVIPSQALGTPLTAAPVLGLIATVIMIALQALYLKWQEDKARKNGEHWAFPEGYDTSRYDMEDTSNLPSPIAAFAPIILLLVMIIGASFAKLPIASDSTLLVVLSMSCAFILCLVLNFKYLDKKVTVGQCVNKLLGNGASSGLGALMPLACIVAFGSVVSSTPAFQNIIDWVLTWDISVYWKGVLSTSVIAGITGSSSGGARLCLQYLGDYFLNSGADLDVLHRLISIAAGTLDSLPHSSGFPAMFAFFGLTHKNAYRHPFWVSVIIPAIVVTILTVAVSLIY